jgi:DNA (cytosine-5)-methyltransferase 1
MNYLSVCSGIEAATVAWHSLGWTPLAFSEIEKFPSQVLAHHYPNTPNLGDMTRFKEWNFESDVNVLVGGTPCQSFSVAGLRKGLDDPRGNLMLTYLAIAAKQRPKWVVWENVPGVLSSNGGLDFASFLRGLGQLGYGFAYRVLDAQYFGVAQRRRRVFVVGYLGNWRPAAAVLFERHSLCAYPAPSREKREGTSASIASGSPVSDYDVAGTLDKGTPGRGIGHNGNYDSQVVSVGRNNSKECLSTYSTPEIGSIREDSLSSCITKNTGGGGETQNPAFVLQAIALAENTIGRKPENGGNGDGFTENGPMYTLNATGVHGVAQPINIYGGNKRQDRPEGGFYVRMDENISKTLDSATGLNPTCSQGGTAVMQPIPFDTTQITSKANYSKPQAGDPCHPLAAGAHPPAIAQAMDFPWQSALDPIGNPVDLSGTLVKNQTMAVAHPIGWSEELTASVDMAGTLQYGGQGGRHDGVMTQAMQVRRLTPMECERLQGFPDGYTDIQLKGKATPDGPRYKALGNSMAVPVMRWIGERIAQVEGIA